VHGREAIPLQRATKTKPKNPHPMKTVKTTAAYPVTRAEAEASIARSITKWGKNEAPAHVLGYRRNGVPGTGGGTIAYSFVESPRTDGAYKEIGHC
jgi:hypothetical protein